MGSALLCLSGCPTAEADLATPEQEFEFLRGAQPNEVVEIGDDATTYKFVTQVSYERATEQMQEELSLQGWECLDSGATFICDDPDPPEGIREHSASVRRLPEGEIEITVWEYY